jgi:hypothetical protein
VAILVFNERMPAHSILSEGKGRALRRMILLANARFCG